MENPWKSHKELQVTRANIKGGSFGQVSIANHNLTNELFAIKKVSINKSVQELSELKRVLDEVIIQNKICSENVVKYVNSWLEDNTAEILVHEVQLNDYSSTTTPSETYFMFIQMEYCNGDLGQFLEEDKQDFLTTQEVFQMFLQLSLGLAAIHKTNIIHRDLKPVNILFSIQSNGQKLWKIGDFGLGIISENQEHSAKGTRAYRSPQMIKGLKYTNKTDIFSLGLVFLETFIKPTKRGNEVKTDLFYDLQHVPNDQDMPSLNDWCLTDFPNLLVKKMLSRDENNRPSAMEICELIQNDENLKNEAVPISRSEGSKHSSSLPSTSLEISKPEHELVLLNVKPPTYPYVGQLQEMAVLDVMVKNPKTSLVVITGLGGIGKSELCRQFIANFTKTQHINCIWISGDSDEKMKKSMMESFKVSKGDIKSLTDRLELEITKEFNNWLVVIDNVEVLSEALVSLIRTVVHLSNTTVILTSRKRNIIKGHYKPIELVELSPEEAQNFVIQVLEMEAVDESVKRICNALQNHPLALQQAVAYIREMQNISTKGDSYGIDDYFQAYSLSKENVLNYELCPISNNYKFTVFTTFDISMEQFNTMDDIGRAAVKLMSIIAYLNPDRVDVTNLKRIYSNLESANNNLQIADEALTLIKTYSLVQIKEPLLNVHRLVQEVIRLKLFSKHTEFNFLNDLIHAMFKAIPEQSLHDYETQNNVKLFLDEIISVWNYTATKYPDIYISHKLTPNKLANIIMNLHKGGMWLPFFDNEWENFCFANLSSLNDRFGDSDLEVVFAKRNFYHIKMWNNKEKQPVLQTTLQNLLTECINSGPMCDHIVTEIQESIAIGFYYLKEYKKAAETWKDVLQSRTRTLGENHFEILYVKEQLSEALVDGKLWPEAVKCLRDLVSWKKEMLTMSSFSTRHTMERLADVFCSQKNYRDALGLFKEIYEHAASYHEKVEIYSKIEHIEDRLAGRNVAFNVHTF